MAALPCSAYAKAVLRETVEGPRHYDDAKGETKGTGVRASQKNAFDAPAGPSGRLLVAREFCSALAAHAMGEPLVVVKAALALLSLVARCGEGERKAIGRPASVPVG